MENDSSTPDTTGGDGPELRQWACVSCAQKKIKCDRLVPACSHCVAKDRECEYKAPPPPNRKKRKTDQSLEQRMLNRILEYEQILQRMHVPFESFLDSERKLLTDGESRDVRRPADSRSPDVKREEGEEAGRLWQSADGAKEMYYSHGLLVSLTEEFKDGLLLEPDVSSESLSQDEGPEGPSSLASRLCSPSPMPLQAQWIPGSMLVTFMSKLWPVFMEGVHPVTMIIHAPSVKACIDRVIVRSTTINKTIEALLCAICASALGSLSNTDCEKIFSTDRELLLHQFQSMTLHRLMLAGFYTFPSHASLQAFALLMQSLQGRVPAHTLVIISTIAIRSAASMGMHREGSKLHAPPFETQLRRRIWWFLLAIDSRAVELSGLGGQTLPTFDAQLPLNLNDADLQPGMKDTPPARAGATDMIYVLSRYELVNVHIKCSRVRQTGMPFVPGDVKFDAEIDRLEGRLEGQYLRFCDPLVPLHTLTTTLSRLGITKLRLLWLGITPLSELMPDDDPIKSMMRIIQYDSYLHSCLQTRHFLWHVRNNFPWGAVLHLVEIASRAYPKFTAIGNRAWATAAESFANHPEVFELDPNKSADVPRPLQLGLIYTAARSWEARASVTGESIEDAPPLLQEALRHRAQGLPLSPERDRSMPGAGSTSAGSPPWIGPTAGATGPDPLWASAPPFRSGNMDSGTGGQNTFVARNNAAAGMGSGGHASTASEFDALMSAPDSGYGVFGTGLLDTFDVSNLAGMDSGYGTEAGVTAAGVGLGTNPAASAAGRADLNDITADWNTYGLGPEAFEFYSGGMGPAGGS